MAALATLREIFLFILSLTYTKTEQFKQDMRFRSTIERIIAALVRYNDARRARSYGTAKADFQVKMAATSYNPYEGMPEEVAQTHPRQGESLTLSATRLVLMRSLRLDTRCLSPPMR